MNKALEAAFANVTADVDAALEGFLPRECAPPGELARAMRYSVFAGGKRLRPFLALTICQALGGPRSNAMPAACALEMVHTYSLIHDDLPAMDNDDLRRGKPTSHKVFGEAMAILAGDALLTLAFEVAASSPEAASPVRQVIELARGAGPAGMVAGQAADMAGEGKGGTIDDLTFIHRNKTGALIRAACRMGAIAAGAGATGASWTADEKVCLAGGFGEALGLSFQITDDILDETAPSDVLGKTAGKDAAAGKLTYPALLGLDAARAEGRRQAGQALEILEKLIPRGTILPELVRYVVERSF